MKTASAQYEWARILIAVALTTFFSYLMLRITLPYLAFEIDTDFLVTKQSIIHIKHWRYSFYVHVCTSTFVLFLGIFQFIHRLIYGYKRLHRYIGLTYLIIVVFLSGPSGLIMGYYANGGLYARISFVTLSLLWIGFTAWAYIKVLRRDIEAHKAYMVRSYALTLSAVTLRSYAFILPLFVHMNGRDEYIMIAWLSWIPNLIVAEILIRKKWMTI
jgi:hypothetical protein